MKVASVLGGQAIVALDEGARQLLIPRTGDQWSTLVVAVVAIVLLMQCTWLLVQ